MRKKMDMLHGSLCDKLLWFALPLAATGILQQLFNAADIAVVGRFVNKDAMAAVGSNAPLVGLLVNLFVGISLGTNVVIAQSVGHNDKKRVSDAVHTSVLVALAGGVIFAVIGEIFAVPILNMLDVPEEVLKLSELYLRIYMCGLPVIFLYDFEASIFRSQGDTNTPLIVLTFSGILNVLLNLFFVVVIKMSVGGVALATVVSNGVSALILCILLMRSKQAVHLDIHKFRINTVVLKRILWIGIPAGIQGMIFSLANIIIQAAINSLGTTVMAASSAAFNIEIIAYYVINGFGQACTTFSGQNYGAGNMERCRRILKLSVILAVAFTAISCGLILFFGEEILHLFTTDEEVVRVGYLRLCYIFVAYIFSLLVEIMSGYLRGFGMSAIPAAATLIGVCGVRIAWIYIVFPHYRTFSSIMLIYPISMCVTAVVLWTIYAFSRKKLHKETPFAQSGSGAS